MHGYACLDMHRFPKKRMFTNDLAKNLLAPRVLWVIKHLVFLRGNFLLKMDQPWPIFVYFPFSHHVESNSEPTDPRRPLYPLDFHHGLFYVAT